jgi:hypothetical protein
LATYGDLKTRIITETVRDDLSDVLSAQLALHIAQAIEYFADKRFWFNEGTKTSACVIGNQYAAKPTGMRVVDRVTVSVGGQPRRLNERSLVRIDELAAVTSSGQPIDYAETGDQIRMYPTPNLAYPLTFVGIVDLSTLTNDTDSNAWTVQGYDLITARAKFTLYRGQFKDETGASLAQGEISDALAKLSGETARRLSAGVRAYA